MAERNQKTVLPPAMLDMGMPEEMSPIEEMTDAYNDVPLVEVTPSIPAGEPREIRDIQEP